MDRAAIGIALTAVAKEFQLAPNEMGIVISAFFVGYSIMQIPGGWLADKYGSKIVIITALFCWSLFTLGTGFAASLTMLLVIRFLFGLGEGPFPASSFKAIAEYFPKKERAKFTGGLVSSNYIGSAFGADDYCAAYDLFWLEKYVSCAGRPWIGLYSFLFSSRPSPES